MKNPAFLGPPQTGDLPSSVLVLGDGKGPGCTLPKWLLASNPLGFRQLNGVFQGQTRNQESSLHKCMFLMKKQQKNKVNEVSLFMERDFCHCLLAGPGSHKHSSFW